MGQYEETNTHTLGSWDRYLTPGMKDIDRSAFDTVLKLDCNTRNLMVSRDNAKKETIVRACRGIIGHWSTIRVWLRIIGQSRGNRICNRAIRSASIGRRLVVVHRGWRLVAVYRVLNCSWVLIRSSGRSRRNRLAERKSADDHQNLTHDEACDKR